MSSTQSYYLAKSSLGRDMLAISRPISYDNGKIGPINESNDLTKTLLQRIAEGDSSAVQECIKTYGNLIWSMARRWCADEGEAEDMVQEIFIEIWKNASRFKPETASEKTFIAMIAKRRLIDRLRRRQARPETALSAEIMENQADVSYNPDQSVDAARATEIMKSLNPEQKRVLELSLHLGLSHGEIARVTNLALGTVKSHIRRGLAVVREKLIKPGLPVAQGREVSQ